MQKPKFLSLTKDTAQKIAESPMKIEMKDAPDPTVKMIEISGEFDKEHPTLVAARKLIEDNCDPKYLQSFDEYSEQLKQQLQKKNKP